jgi:hypothetical protein
VTISWLDPNRAYSLEAAGSFPDGFGALPEEPAFSNNECRMTIGLEEGEYRFFRLRLRPPSTD